MGFNISGIAISKNLKNKEDKLSKILDYDNTVIRFEREIDFETASENWKEDGIIDVYFGEKGTLIFANYDLCVGSDYSYAETNILTFNISESSMSFDFTYTENENVVRSKTEHNGEVFDETGEKLECEKKNDDTSEAIWNQIEAVIQKKFWDIEPDEKCFRYKLEQKSLPTQTTEPKAEVQEELKPIIKETPSKKQINNEEKVDMKVTYFFLILFVAFVLFAIIGLIYFVYGMLTM